MENERVIMNDNEIFKYCYWPDDQFLATLKKQMATVEKARAGNWGRVHVSSSLKSSATRASWTI